MPNDQYELMYELMSMDVGPGWQRVVLVDSWEEARAEYRRLKPQYETLTIQHWSPK